MCRFRHSPTHRRKAPRLMRRAQTFVAEVLALVWGLAIMCSTIRQLLLLVVVLLLVFSHQKTVPISLFNASICSY